MSRPSLSVRPTKIVSAVDTSIAGDVVRVVMDGFPNLRAKNAMQALQELRAEHEEFRRFLIELPRGHDDINAILLLPPTSSEAARTAIMAEHFGYVPVAGTLLIAAAVALVETGEVVAQEPETTVILDTAHGRTDVIVTVEIGRATSARWMTDRPRIISHLHQFALDDGRTVSATVISPGLPYLVARADDLGVSFWDVEGLGDAGSMLSRAAGRQLPLKDVGMEQDAADYLVMLVGDYEDEGPGDAAQTLAVWVGSDGDVNHSPTGAHSPTGTGALAVAAYCVEMGKLGVGRSLNVMTPSGQSLRTCIQTAGASVEGEVRVVSLIDLVDE